MSICAWFGEKKGQTSKGDGDGCTNGSECGWEGVGVNNEGGGEGALSGDHRARNDEEKEREPRRHGGREGKGKARRA